jgi:hypothetical protein
MTISLLFGCCQIETSVRSLLPVRTFMTEVLGAEPIEQELARQIAALMGNSGYDVDHLDCGGAVFQVNQPARGMLFEGQKSIHESYLDRLGPCVANLNFFVDDIEHARETLMGMGAAVHIEGPSNVAAALGDYGPGNTRLGGGDRPFLFMGTREMFGFDLEIMEPNFLHFSRQSVQYPAFITPGPSRADQPLRLQRLLIVVEDLAATHDALCLAIAPASRSKPYSLRQGQLGKAFRIGLGGIEIEYCQPVGTSGPLREHLDSLGPGTLAVVFSAATPETVVARQQERHGSATDCAFDPLGLGEHETRIACRDLIGFDVILGPPEPDLH